MYSIDCSGVSYSRKFKCSQHVYNVKFNDTKLTFGQGQNQITNMFTEIHEQLLYLLTNNYDKIRITFIHNSFDHPIGKLLKY